jgi:WD40 repeat protein
MRTSKARWQVVLIALGVLLAISGFAIYWIGHESPIAVLRAPSVPIYAIRFSPDGSKLGAGVEDGTFRLWDVRAKALLAVLPEANAPPWLQSTQNRSRYGTIRAAIQMDPGGRGKTVDLIDTTSGAKLRSISGHPDQINDVALSADGTMLATAGGYTSHPWPVNSGGDSRVYAVKTGRLLAKFRDHWGAVFAVAIAPDGKTLATAGSDGTIKLWDISRFVGRVRHVSDHH